MLKIMSRHLPPEVQTCGPAACTTMFVTPGSCTKAPAMLDAAAYRRLQQALLLLFAQQPAHGALGLACMHASVLALPACVAV